MNLLGIKLISLVILFIVTFVCCMIPFAMFKKFQKEFNQERRDRYKRIFSFLSCFGCGVFLATCFLHLLPESEQVLDSGLKVYKYDGNFPVSKFVVVFGFLVVLTLEQIVQDFNERKGVEPFGSHSHNHAQREEGISESDDESEHLLNQRSADYTTSIQHSTHTDPSSHSSLRSVILVFALSLHAVFEGVAMGFQENSQEVASLLAAILIHKSILAFTLGLNISQSKLKHRIDIICFLIFSIMAPLGMVIGIGIMNFMKGERLLLVSGILESMATGTFIYIIFFEILPHELNIPMDRIAKLFWIIIGYAVFTLVVYYLPS